jgi:hypothetical protein
MTLDDDVLKSQPGPRRSAIAAETIESNENFLRMDEPILLSGE